MVVTVAVIFFGGHYLNALKLRLLAGPERPDQVTAACVRAQYAGLVANLGLPGLAGGDMVRAAYLVPIVGVRRVAVASIADRVIDTCTILVLVAVALPLAGVPPAIASVASAGRVAGSPARIAAVAAAAIVLRSTCARRKFARTPVADISWTASRWTELAGGGRHFAPGAVGVCHDQRLAGPQVGVTTGLAAWFVAWPLSKLIAVLPISLGGIGVREAALVSLLAPYGAPREAVLASGILVAGRPHRHGPRRVPGGAHSCAARAGGAGRRVAGRSSA